MGKKMRIVVTQKDIDEGRKAIETKLGPPCNVCPIARAVRKHKSFKEAQVSKSYITLDELSYCMLPTKAQNFIADFDALKPVKPFQFTVEI